MITIFNVKGGLKLHLNNSYKLLSFFYVKFKRIHINKVVKFYFIKVIVFCSNDFYHKAVKNIFDAVIASMFFG
jgi:hypothetical protein